MTIQGNEMVSSIVIRFASQNRNQII